MSINHLPEKCVAQIKSLFEIFRKFEGIRIAFSGGMDSSFLALAAKKSGIRNIETHFVVSELITKAESIRARNISEKYGFHFSERQISVLQDPLISENPAERCYHCKKAIFSMLMENLPAGWILCDGTQLSDADDHRPGKRALKELGVKSPLVEAGIDKRMIIDALRFWQASDLIRSPQPCLATRFPVGTHITDELLRKIEAGEEILKNTGLTNLRLRYHKDIARIEVAPENIEEAAGLMKGCVEEIKNLGFKFVTLDLAGYKTGSMN
ncbi:MAG: ATP-dependent sacrificial sulfur transferase LarE [Candidatus Riflebacteria bacterium]|nr:ATP-dependent sacrificial sulfur transferase LarE [Candidatus Riflebacteria bacterium]